jgi:hypothetical protein
MDTDGSPGPADVSAELAVEALCAARALLEHFPGMQDDLLPAVAALFSSQRGTLLHSNPFHTSEHGQGLCAQSA